MFVPKKASGLKSEDHVPKLMNSTDVRSPISVGNDPVNEFPAKSKRDTEKEQTNTG
jgi:hypothetical protein